MAYLLQIETSTASCSVALSFQGQTIGYKEQSGHNIHASMLTVFIQELMQNAKITLNHLSAIAVSKGPGSYTGLRIGVSVAKGLAFALDIPLISYETLQAMVEAVYQDYSDIAIFCPMIDARRMEVYTALYNKNAVLLRNVEAKIITKESFQDELAADRVLFFGDGASKCQEVFKDNANAVFLLDFNNTATSVSKQVLQKYINKEFEDLAYFEPYYLKEFVSQSKHQ